MSTPTKQLLYSSVRIETKSLDGSTGCGTSFVFRDQTSPPGQDLFLVSNKHVVEGTDTCHIFFTSQGQDGQPKLGEPFFVRSDMFSAQWHGHPTASVDVAVMPLSWQLDLIAKDGQIPFLRPISLGDIAPVFLETLTLQPQSCSWAFQMGCLMNSIIFPSSVAAI